MGGEGWGLHSLMASNLLSLACCFVFFRVLLILFVFADGQVHHVFPVGVQTKCVCGGGWVGGWGGGASKDPRPSASMSSRPPALTSTSLPDSTAGSACAWIGVGAWYPALATAAARGASKPHCEKVLTGRGTSMPEMRMERDLGGQDEG